MDFRSGQSSGSTARPEQKPSDEVVAGGGGRPRPVSGSLYAPGLFPSSSKSAAPPIYLVAGGGRRSAEGIQVDVRLRAAQSPSELLDLVQQGLHRFDVGNVVVAFTCAAKLDDGQNMATLDPHSAWKTLK
ncbi:unnamed protein product, partial [Polarella glacialis]